MNAVLRAALLAGAALVAGVVARPAFGHFRTEQGQWLYRYYTRAAGPSACDTNRRESWVDPLNVLFAPFGGQANADAHIRADSGFGDTVFNGDQDACGADAPDAPDATPSRSETSTGRPTARCSPATTCASSRSTTLTRPSASASRSWTSTTST